MVATQKEAGALALRAGVDMDITYEPAYMSPLIENVQEGKVSEALVDRAVRRILALKFRLGLFEHPYAEIAPAQRAVHSAEHQDLALRVARKGIVLLKNADALLPLRRDLKSIAVIGPNADDGWSQLGDYTPKAVLQKINTVLDGIRRKLPGTSIEYVHGCDVLGGNADFAAAVAAVRRASVAVVVVGEHPDNGGRGTVPPTDGEAYDVASLDLTGHQEELVRAVRASGTPVVLVLINGRPLSIPWEATHLPAIVEAWKRWLTGWWKNDPSEGESFRCSRLRLTDSVDSYRVHQNINPFHGSSFQLRQASPHCFQDPPAACFSSRVAHSKTAASVNLSLRTV